jgi:hypothetical protein
VRLGFVGVNLIGSWQRLLRPAACCVAGYAFKTNRIKDRSSCGAIQRCSKAVAMGSKQVFNCELHSWGLPPLGAHVKAYL